MKKILIVCLIMLLFIISLSACANDPVRKDLLNYLNVEVGPLAALETEALGAWVANTGNNYKDDPTLYRALNETIIPKFGEFTSKLVAIKPETPEVQKIHDILLEATKLRNEGFKICKEAIDKKSSDLINTSNEKLASSEAKTKEYMAAAKELGKKYNVNVFSTPK
ncbi:MAG: hypothetical protein ACYDIA_21885 [Candidatus Humimicrobiaceae bacterium]